MKRDMELVQKVLEHVEEHVTPSARPLREIELPGYEEEVITYHVGMCAAKGFILRNGISIEGLSWDGHTLLDALRLASEDVPNG